MVLRIQYGFFSATLTGDATSESLSSIQENYKNQNLGTTLLVAPHHGAVTEGSNNFSWAQVFQPLIVVYSAGTLYSHPRCEALLQYIKGKTLQKASNHPLQCGEDRSYFYPWTDFTQFLTETNGSISVESNENSQYAVFCSPNANCTLKQ